MSAAAMVMEAVAERTSESGTVVARLESVTKRYGAVTALDGVNVELRRGVNVELRRGVNVELRRGEIVALLGPNGAGKSTAVRLLLGLSAPDAGTVRILGGDPRRRETRTRAGVMLQVASVPRTLKVKEHIDLFRSYYPAPLSAAEVVRLAQLEGIEGRMFEQLSGGQKQRLLFGLAVCGDPEVVFLDEPTVGMDIEARHALWAQVRALRERGRTVLMTTHYLEEADALADRIVVIDRGRVISEGTPAEVKGRCAGRRIRCVTTLSSAQLWAIPEVVDVQQKNGVTTVVAGDAENVVRRMLKYDEELSGLEIVSPGLEEAFLQLTRR